MSSFNKGILYIIIGSFWWGVIGVIYESRPNVTSDVASLCLKSGNCVILRGGSEACHTNKILSDLFREALRKNKIDENCVQFIEDQDRNIVDYMLSKMENQVIFLFKSQKKNVNVAPALAGCSRIALRGVRSTPKS